MSNLPFDFFGKIPFEFIAQVRGFAYIKVIVFIIQFRASGTIAVLLLVLWGLGLITSYTLGGFIHLLLVIAIIMVIIGPGRNTVRSITFTPESLPTSAPLVRPVRSGWRRRGRSRRRRPDHVRRGSRLAAPAARQLRRGRGRSGA